MFTDSRSLQVTEFCCCDRFVFVVHCGTELIWSLCTKLKQVTTSVEDWDHYCSPGELCVPRAPMFVFSRTNNLLFLSLSKGNRHRLSHKERSSSKIFRHFGLFEKKVIETSVATKRRVPVLRRSITSRWFIRIHDSLMHKYSMHFVAASVKCTNLSAMFVYTRNPDWRQVRVQQYWRSVRGESSLLDKSFVANVELQSRDEKSTQHCHARGCLPPGWLCIYARDDNWM